MCVARAELRRRGHRPWVPRDVDLDVERDRFDQAHVAVAGRLRSGLILNCRIHKRPFPCGDVPSCSPASFTSASGTSSLGAVDSERLVARCARAPVAQLPAAGGAERSAVQVVEVRQRPISRRSPFNYLAHIMEADHGDGGSVLGRSSQKVNALAPLISLRVNRK